MAFSNVGQRSRRPFRSSLPFSLQSMLLPWFFAVLSVFFAGCDSVEPSEENLLVVEGFLNAGAPLPLISITKANTLDQNTHSSNEVVRDASFRIFFNNQAIPYGPSNIEEGKYAPLPNNLTTVPPNAAFRAELEWRSQRATISDVIPPPILIDSVRIHIPSQPVAAILVDTLKFDNPQVGARKGYIYPIDVTLFWIENPADVAADSVYWIETRLQPLSDFSSTVLDVFLLTEEVQSENAITPSEGIYKKWTGVYAVPVTDSLSPPPDHNLTVQLIRGSKAYANFAASRNTPERREPVSNIKGAIGILAGISMDSIAFEVKNGLATARQ